MSRKALFAAVVLVLTLGAAGSGPVPGDVEEEVVALERSALDGWAQGDTSGFLDIVADDVTWFDFTEGEQLRVEGLEAVRAYLEPMGEGIPPHTYELVSPKVQVYGDCAVLTFHWSAVSPDGTPLPKWKATSVYHRENGRWRQVHAHWSVVQGA